MTTRQRKSQAHPLVTDTEALAATRNGSQQHIEEDADDHSDDKKQARAASSLKDDYWNIAVLLFLYTLQGFPMGLSSTLDLMLQELNLPFEKQAIFGFITLPFSLKLLWAPIVDSVYLPSVGRRKSWLIPVQLLLGLLLLFSARMLPQLLAIEEHTSDTIAEPKIYTLTALFIVFYFLAATQDIAVDGWAVTMLKPEHVGYASTCNSIGQTFGYIISYTGFLGLKTYGIIELPEFLQIWGFIFILSTLLIAFFKKEGKETSMEKGKEASASQTVSETYSQVFKILKLPRVRELIFYFMTVKAAFAACDNLSQRKLIQKGLTKEQVASVTLLLTPLSLLLPGLVSGVTSKKPLTFFKQALLPRYIMCGASTLFVYFAPDMKASTGADTQSDMNSVWFWLPLVTISLITVAVQSIMFVSSMSFFAMISDERIGGTYMTLLNTMYNISSLVSNQAVLLLVNEVSMFGIDGFYILNMLSLVYGCYWYIMFSGSFVRLETVPKSKWAVSL